MLMASVIGEVLGVFGTAAAIAEIFLYKSSVNTTGGNEVTSTTIEEGTLTLSDLEFKYPTK